MSAALIMFMCQFLDAIKLRKEQSAMQRIARFITYILVLVIVISGCDNYLNDSVIVFVDE